MVTGEDGFTTDNVTGVVGWVFAPDNITTQHNLGWWQAGAGLWSQRVLLTDWASVHGTMPLDPAPWSPSHPCPLPRLRCLLPLQWIFKNQFCCWVQHYRAEFEHIRWEHSGSAPEQELCLLLQRFSDPRPYLLWTNSQAHHYSPVVMDANTKDRWQLSLQSNIIQMSFMYDF